MKVFFWAGDKGSGSTFYRCHLPSMGLQWLGHQTGVSVDSRVGSGADVVVGARVAHPNAMTPWQRMKDRGTRLVLDLDDDYFHLDSRHHDQKGIAEWESHQARLIHNMDISDVVTCASEAIAEVVRKHTATPAVVIPNALPAQLIGYAKDYRQEVVTVGWSGSASTKDGLEMIKHALRKTAERRDVQVLLVGPGKADPYLNGLRHRANIRTTGFISNQFEYLDVCRQFDIWLAPYEESAFNRAKFPTKVLESNFLGIPLIASDIRPYREQIVHGKTGFLVRSDHEWRKYISLLIEDPDLRQEIGMNARDQASTSILQSVNKRWEEVCQG